MDPDRFVDYYISNGWRVGKNPMKDWRATVRTWETNGVSKDAWTGRVTCRSPGVPPQTRTQEEDDLLDGIL